MDFQALPATIEKKVRNLKRRDVAVLLKSEFGNISAVASKLGQERWVINHIIRSDPELSLVYQDVLESNLDAVEQSLFISSIGGHFGAIRYYLDTHGQDRGYGKQKRKELENIEDLSDEELEKAIEDAEFTDVTDDSSDRS